MAVSWILKREESPEGPSGEEFGELEALGISRLRRTLTTVSVSGGVRVSHRCSQPGTEVSVAVGEARHISGVGC